MQWKIKNQSKEEEKEFVMRRIIAKTKHKRLFFLLIITFSICVVMLFNYFSSQNTMFKITRYSISTEKPIKDLRILLISDLHLKEYGEDNEILLNSMKELNPDIITVVGDSVIYNNKNWDGVIDFLNASAEIAPTYFSSGNHEWTLIYHYKDYKLLHALKNCKATFLNNQMGEITIGDNKIVICGIYDEPDARYGYGERILPEFNRSKYDDKFKLLLSHCPLTIANTSTTPRADLVLSGHEHGGQIIIPGTNQGLYSKNQGFLPKYAVGMYPIAGNTVIISTGLSNSYHLIPRINNQPEVVVIDVN
jgi:predicted MPP superfamily phosphohydrolase